MNALKWHGGKVPLASKIIALFPPHLHYVEPYFGGGGVLLNKDPEGVSEVVNDLNGELINFWRVLQKEFEPFKRRLEATPVAKAEFDRPSVRLHDVDLNAACAFFVKMRMSFGGQGKNFHALSKTRTRRGMNEQASGWWSAVEGLEEVYHRMKRVVIYNEDALEVIRREDGPSTLFYLDPPYVLDTRSGEVYAHEMTNAQHQELLHALRTIKGRFFLSGYANDMYDTAAKLTGWRRTDFDVPNHAAGGGTKRRMTECIWSNT